MTQYAVPIQDDVITRWVNSATDQIDLYSYINSGIDSGTSNTTEYIQGNPNLTPPLDYVDNDIYVSKLTSLSDPDSSSSHILKYRAGGGGFGSCSISFELAQTTGGGYIARETRNFSPGGSPDTGLFSLTLSAAEADNITDYSSLYFRASGTNGVSTQIFIYEVEFQIPDEPPPPVPAAESDFIRIENGCMSDFRGMVNIRG
jgi:hypothetical protein